ncbi:MAG: hypothetical protein M1826_005000 [Phylliscum demangeonii]|nr:MAG: hypothetical protein M1826_005000 [Phylliscum demangeonii]
MGKPRASSARSEFPSTATKIPPASSFDIVPVISTLLSRLHPHATSTDPVLEAQHLPIEASAVKIKIQKAQALVASLPDMDRTVEEQEAEMHQLEGRIKRQRDMLAGVAEKARQARDGVTGGGCVPDTVID